MMSHYLKAKASKVVCSIRSMSHDWCSLSHCPFKQSIHVLLCGLGNDLFYRTLYSTKWQETSKVKIEAHNIRCLIISKEKLQRLFALFVPYLMTGVLYHTVPPNNPYMFCCVD